MVTDPPAEDEERAASPSSSATRLLVTALLVAPYLAGHRVLLPGVHPDLPADGPLASRLTLLALGMTPLVTGFLLVELFALATTPGRRLRTAGSAGRGRLNRAALVTSLVLSAVQALGIGSLRRFRVGKAGAIPEPRFSDSETTGKRFRNREKILCQRRGAAASWASPKPR